MSDVRSVVVAGSRFGQFYAAGVAADRRFVLRGILGQGRRRSRALAERLGWRPGARSRRCRTMSAWPASRSAARHAASRARRWPRR